MAKQKMVIAGSDNVTAKQLKELMNQIDEKVVTGTIIQNLLENAKGFQLKPLDLHRRLPSVLLLIKNGGEASAITEGLTEKDFMLSDFVFQVWKELIMYSVGCTRLYFKELDVTTHSSYIAYHEKCWKKIDNAGDDNFKLNEAIAFLGMTMANHK